MNDWQSLLRQADSARDVTLTEHEAQSIRRLVVATARESRDVSFGWPRPMALAAMLIVTIAAGVAASRWLPFPESPQTPVASTPPSELDGRRQLQFATPGGTRIIWTFNPDFDVKEATP